MSIYHKHHIIPKHMGGTDDPSNLVELTVEKHAEAHRKLFEQYGHWQDELAWKGLAGIIGKEEIISRMNTSYGFLGKKHSEEHLQKIIGEGNPFYGRKHSEETKKKISNAVKNRSPETLKKLSDASKGNSNWLGKKLSAEHKRKISESKKKHKTLLLQSNDI